MKYELNRGERFQPGFTQAGLVVLRSPRIQMQNNSTEQRVTEIHIFRSNKFNEGFIFVLFSNQQSTIYTV